MYPPANVTVIKQPISQTKLSNLRDFAIDCRKFRSLLNEISAPKVYEVTQGLADATAAAHRVGRGCHG